VLAGGLVAWLGAPVAVLVDAVSYLVSGVLIAVTPIDEPAPERSARGVSSVVTELREGLRWVYRHPTLRPLALGGHAWFLFNAVLGTVYIPFALRELGMGAIGLGVTLTLAGVGGFVGSSLWGWLGRRLSPVRILAGARLLEAAGFAVVAGAPLGGLLADAAAPRLALWVGVLGVAVSAVALAASGFRHANHDD
jgi:MFS-type transporter involved in bile tolerance (Atg22 family)